MVQTKPEFLKILISVELVFCNILNAYEPISAALLCRETNPVRTLKLFELEERCFLFSLLVSLEIIQWPQLVACSNLLVLQKYLHVSKEDDRLDKINYRPISELNVSFKILNDSCSSK